MKIAFITSRFPYPVEKGDKLRAYQHLRWLGARHEVHLFAITHREVEEEQIRAVKSMCAGVHVYRIRKSRVPFNMILGWLDGLPGSVAYFLDRRQKRRMQDDLIRFQPQHVFVQLIRAAEYVRALPVPKTLDYMDVFSFGAAQRTRSAMFLLKPFYAIEANRLRRYEKAVYGDFTNHVIISAQDRDRLPLPYQRSVLVLSNGVDLNYFTPEPQQIATYDVVFVGNLGYLPNIEAAAFLVREIMPEVWKQLPQATVCLAGVRPHARVMGLKSERVTVTGWVDDIRPYYSRGRVFVAPMLSGMGQQNKILEAMAMGLPCITTPLVDAAIGAAREDAVLIAEDPNTFVQLICMLLADPLKAKELGRKAREFASHNYSWEMKNNLLESLLTGNAASRKTEPVRI